MGVSKEFLESLKLMLQAQVKSKSYERKTSGLRKDVRRVLIVDKVETPVGEYLAMLPLSKDEELVRIGDECKIIVLDMKRVGTELVSQEVEGKIPCIAEVTVAQNIIIDIKIEKKLDYLKLLAEITNILVNHDINPESVVIKGKLMRAYDSISFLSGGITFKVRYNSSNSRLIEVINDYLKSINVNPSIDLSVIMFTDTRTMPRTESTLTSGAPTVIITHILPLPEVEQLAKIIEKLEKGESLEQIREQKVEEKQEQVDNIEKEGKKVEQEIYKDLKGDE